MLENKINNFNREMNKMLAEILDDVRVTNFSVNSEKYIDKLSKILLDTHKEIQTFKNEEEKI